MAPVLPGYQADRYQDLRDCPIDTLQRSGNGRDESRWRCPSLCGRIKEDIQRGDLPISDDDDIEPCIVRRLAWWPGAPYKASAVLNGLWSAMRCVDEIRMTGAQFTGDLINRRVADIAAGGKKNHAVIGV